MCNTPLITKFMLKMQSLYGNSVVRVHSPFKKGDHNKTLSFAPIHLEKWSPSFTSRKGCCDEIGCCVIFATIVNGDIIYRGNCDMIVLCAKRLSIMR